MNIPISKATNQTINNSKIVLFVYFINLVFGLMIALPLASSIESAQGIFGSLATLKDGFDFTLFNDFLGNYGKGVGAIINVAKWLIPFYLIVQVFVSGGILNAFFDHEEEYSISNFLKYSASFFWRYFFVTLIFLVKHLIGFLIVLLPLTVIFSDGIEGVKSEATYWTAMYWSLPIYLILFLIISAAADYTKISMIKHPDAGFFKHIAHGWKSLFSQLISTFLVYLICLVFIIVLYVFYWNVSDIISPAMSIGIILMFLFQQLINVVRVMTKFIYLSSLINLVR